MDEFTASNGIEIEADIGTEGAMLLSGNTYLTTQDVQALREFFQAEADEQFGRWRDPQQSDFIVYGPFDPEEIGYDLIVIDERTGERAYYSRSDDDGGGNAFEHPWSNKHAWAARHWFAAHPEPKPWHNAQEGEVWVLETVRENTLPMICQAEAFRDHGGYFPLDSEEIVNATRIYPA